MNQQQYCQHLIEAAQQAQQARPLPKVPMPEVPDVQRHRAALDAARALHNKIRQWALLDADQRDSVRQGASKGLCAASEWLTESEAWARLRGGQASKNLLAVLESFRMAAHAAGILLDQIETGDPEQVADTWRDAFIEGVDSGRHLICLSHRAIPRIKR
jgi:hypothetical protein